MGLAVTADPDTRIIDLTVAPVGGLSSLNVASELYSALKDDWHSTAALQKLRFPLEPVAGDQITASESIGKYVFVNNQDGWRLRPYDADQELSITGNVFARDNTLPLWLSRTGRTIIIQLERSSLATVASAGIEPYWVMDNHVYDANGNLTQAEKRYYTNASLTALSRTVQVLAVYSGGLVIDYREIEAP